LPGGHRGRQTIGEIGLAKADAFDYIERFYNPRRRYSTIGYLSPMDFEEQMRLA
jgi:transposase InsO family protein